MFATVPLFQGNPITFLKHYLAMSKRPDRYQIGFDEHDLRWCLQVWTEVVMAGVGNPAKDYFIHERDRFEKLHKDLSAENVQRKEGGITFLNEASDWPMPKVLEEAIRCLEHAQVTTLQ